jgi:hypothetical protein
MLDARSDMPLNPRPWDQSFNERYIGSLNAELIREGKEWRTREAAAGRPSEFEDLCRFKGLCSACAATGIAMNENRIGFKVVGMDGDVQLYGDCDLCGGTGKVAGE